MNSLQELNGYSQTTLSYNDARDFVITFDRTNPNNINLSTTEGNAVSNLPGINIISLQSASNITYTIDMGIYSNIVLAWDTLPYNQELYSANGVYRFANVASVDDWNLIKNFTLTMPNSWAGTYSFTSNITYPTYLGANIKGWDTTVYVEDLAEMTSAGTHDYDPNRAEVITNYPQITDAENDGLGIYTLEITAGDISAFGSLTSNAIGGTSNWTPHVLTISGNRATVNAHLANITYTPAEDYELDFTLQYTLTNPDTSVYYTTQAMVVDGFNLETDNMTLARSYIENRSNILFPNTVPSISEIHDSDNYTVSLRLAADIGSIGLEESLLPAGWNPGTRTYTYNGSRSEVNAMFANVKFNPYADTATSTTVTYNQYRGSVHQANLSFDLVGYTSTDAIPGAGVYTFTTDSTFVANINLSSYLKCDVLVVGGGGAGGWGYGRRIADSRTYWQWGGGGGAGGLYYEEDTDLFSTGGTYTITVGTGGRTWAQGQKFLPDGVTFDFTESLRDGGDGTASRISRNGINLIAVNGGGGGGGSGVGDALNASRPGRPGASGGGACATVFSTNYNQLSGGSAISGQGYAGGGTDYTYAGVNAGSGGGYANAGVKWTGINPTDQTNPQNWYVFGGRGANIAITGNTVEYCAGGFSYINTPGSGGQGGSSEYGGGGATTLPINGQDGIVILKFYKD